MYFFHGIAVYVYMDQQKFKSSLHGIMLAYIDHQIEKKEILTHLFLSSLHLTSYRYAIGNAERPGLLHKIGWLDHLANATHQYYYSNSTGGPTLRVSVNISFSLYFSLRLTIVGQ